MLKFRCILIWRFPSVVPVFTMGKLNFRRYLTSRFYSTHEIHESLMTMKNMFYSTACPLQTACLLIGFSSSIPSFFISFIPLFSVYRPSWLFIGFSVCHIVFCVVMEVHIIFNKSDYICTIVTV